MVLDYVVSPRSYATLYRLFAFARVHDTAIATASYRIYTYLAYFVAFICCFWPTFVFHLLFDCEIVICTTQRPARVWHGLRNVCRSTARHPCYLTSRRYRRCCNSTKSRGVRVRGRVRVSVRVGVGVGVGVRVSG